MPTPTQQYGMDYEEAFAPVAKMTIIRTLIAIASVRQWRNSQLDVKNAFLNGDFQEEVYMAPPPSVLHDSGYVCKLKKAFDAGRIILSLYVDDMIITGDDIDGISVLKIELARQFEMKDLGSLRYFLDILERARLTDNKIVDTPIEVNTKYFSSDGLPLSDPTLYRTIVGSLVYLTITRPDITYTVHIVSQFVASSTTVHWVAVLRILRYFRGTVFQSLLFPSTSSLELRAYSDADHGSDPTDRKSVTGFCIFLGDSLISWKNKKFFFLIPLLCIATTKVLFRLLTTCWQTLDACSCRIVSLRGDVKKYRIIYYSLRPLLYTFIIEIGRKWDNILAATNKGEEGTVVTRGR
ncbi:uncharacterized protein LOC111374959 [Olea europaea var. sylvestris]|uniref:uncharacterized protein LOC111374959 n=1 Tax=Olea europaea var. sylvestris TaxID=158386 RepID=UPI000C1CE39E|nr:uncharacterized protein LOC111374959 [Olea europaea var. sylvestris]